MIVVERLEDAYTNDVERIEATYGHYYEVLDRLEPAYFAFTCLILANVKHYVVHFVPMNQQRKNTMVSLGLLAFLMCYPRDYSRNLCTVCVVLLQVQNGVAVFSLSLKPAVVGLYVYFRSLRLLARILARILVLPLALTSSVTLPFVYNRGNLFSTYFSPRNQKRLETF